MKRLIIIGARGFGREVYNLALDCKIENEVFSIKGFLDDKSDVLLGYNNYPPIISSVENYEVQPDDVFACALGDVNAKIKYIDLILKKGGKFISLIHPSVQIGLNTQIGNGCIIRTTASISCDVSIGSFVTIMGYSILGHDVKIGDYCHLGAYSFLGGFSQLKENVTLHPGAKILPHKIVKKNAIVGAGSVVLKNVNENTTVFGIPAKKIEL